MLPPSLNILIKNILGKLQMENEFNIYLKEITGA
jgi:hypothetical protein